MRWSYLLANILRSRFRLLCYVQILFRAGVCSGSPLVLFRCLSKVQNSRPEQSTENLVYVSSERGELDPKGDGSLAC